MSPDTDESGMKYYYIGKDDCKKASCNQKQEFPKADDPYCVVHSLEDYFIEDRSADSDASRGDDA